jgi:mannose-6-phosphate isomerase
MFYPLTFVARLKERVWGGRKLELLYRKPLPPGVPIGESWEISDRPGDESVVAQGPWAGRSLRWLMENHGPEILGEARVAGGRFPLLIKILDAREVLSVQVHPPADIAVQLRGEPKTEMWFVADADPGAELLAGLRKGTTKSDFQRQLQKGTVAESLHRLPVQRGDALFLPSGRIHALGAGVVVFEIQQNSDTTYRVFDWNRVGLDGRPRALHVPESLASIDFSDIEPALAQAVHVASRGGAVRELVSDELFTVRHCSLRSGEAMALPDGKMQIIGVLSGSARVSGNTKEVLVRAGDFVLLPACLDSPRVEGVDEAAFLLVEAGKGGC